MSKVAVYKVSWRNTLTKSEGSGYVVTQVPPIDPKFTDPKWLEDHPAFVPEIPYQHTGSDLIGILSFNLGFAIDDVEVVTREVVTAEAFDGRDEVKFGDTLDVVKPVRREKPIVPIHESAAFEAEPVIDAQPGTSEFAAQSTRHRAWEQRQRLAQTSPSAVTGQAVSNDVVVTETKPATEVPSTASFTPVVPATDSNKPKP